jgi:two-component system sensor histidine kinase/response regulator
MKLYLAIASLFLSSSNDAIVSMDTQATIETWNLAAETIFGFSEKQALGENFFSLVEVHRIHNFNVEALSQISEGQSLPLIETEAITSRGSTRAISVNLSATSRTGKDTGKIVAIIRDVTDQRATEAQIRQLNTSLEEKVEKRTEELEQARNEAVRATQYKSEFIANVSHEIRTPLNGVIGTLGILDKTTLDERQSRLTNMARTSAQTLANLINDILDLSKIEAGKLEIDSHEFNIQALFDEVLGSFQLSAQEKGNQLLLDLSGIEQEWLIGDENRIRQILVNLIGNAIKFTEHGTISVCARLNEYSPGKLTLEAEIQDSGIGIDADKQEQLFEAFSQEDVSTTRKFGGTGLGLNICRRLLRLMNGNIGVKSEKGHGSTFKFDLEVQAGPELPLRINLDKHAVSKALIVSDNSNLSKILESQLGSWGIECNLIDDLKNYLELLGSSLVHHNRILLDVNEANSETTEQLNEILAETPSLGDTCVLIGSEQSLEKFSEHQHLLALPVTPISLANMLFSGEQLAQPSSTERPALDINVLVVDDNSINVEVASDLLHELGCRTQTADNGREAINLLKQQDCDVDLILMDCQMPVMDGYAASISLRKGVAGERYIDVPIIAATASALKGTEEECRCAGMNDYLTKPFDVNDFEAMIIKWAAQITGEAIKHEGNTDAAQQAGNNMEQGFEHEDSVETHEPGHNISTFPSPEVETNNEESPSMEPLSIPIWEKDVALKKLRGRQDRLAHLVRMFIHELPTQLEKITTHLKGQQDGLQEADFETISFISHSIKGGAGNLCATALFEVSKNLEHAAREQDELALRNCFPAFIEATEGLTIAFEEFLISQESA